MTLAAGLLAAVVLLGPASVVCAFWLLTVGDEVPQ